MSARLKPKFCLVQKHKVFTIKNLGFNLAAIVNFWMVVTMLSAREALQKALQYCGNNQAELARRCGVKQPHVWKWVKAGRVPTERVPSVVKATQGQVKAHELRPDLPEIFPPPDPIPHSA